MGLKLPFENKAKWLQYVIMFSNAPYYMSQYKAETCYKLYTKINC